MFFNKRSITSLLFYLQSVAYASPNSDFEVDSRDSIVFLLDEDSSAGKAEPNPIPKEKSIKKAEPKPASRDATQDSKSEKSEDSDKTDKDEDTTSEPNDKYNDWCAKCGITSVDSDSYNDKEKKSDDSKDEDDSDSKEDDDGDKKIEAKPPAIGNFSLPSSQQPAALFGFGGNIIDKDEVMFYFFADEFIGRHKFIMDLIPSVLFGVTENFSIFFNFPFTPELRDLCVESNGLEDFFVQFEYAFYNSSTWCYVDQATILASIYFPTGSSNLNPPTGLGAPGIFLGATYYRTLVDWILFTAQGALFTFQDRGLRFGNQFLYQFGVSRNLPSPCGWIYALMLELDGQYTQKTRLGAFEDPNSGGNVIFITPSVWMSSKNLLVQFGVSLPVYQHLFGKQRKFDYGLNFNVAWSFY